MFKIEQEKTQDFGPCDCCGSMSRLVAGFSLATFYIILGYWGESALAEDRYAVALRYRCDSEATGFMVVDAQTAVASHPLVGRALTREEVIGTPLAQEMFDVIDFIWLYDDRILEITAHGRTA